MDMCYPGVTLDTSTPEHIRDYIVFRTQIPGRGRTTVHAISCPQIRTTNSTCSCPTFGKYSSTLQLVKHLKVQFGANKSKQPWEESTQVGNPAKSRMVAELLSAIADEQSLAHVVTKQPVMIAYADLFRVCRYLHAISRDRTVDHSHRWRVNRLHSAMLNSYQTWTRCGNINKILTLAVLRVPGSRMLVFGHTWGKTLAAGREHLCGVLPAVQVEMCAVTSTEALVASCTKCGTSATTGFLYRKSCSEDDRETPVPTAMLQGDFRKYLKLSGPYNLEQFSSLRATGATQGLVTGAHLQNLMQTANWASPHTFAHYTRLQELLGLQEVPQIMSQPQQDLTHIQELQRLMSAFH